jgi:hypothetical protein
MHKEDLNYIKQFDVFKKDVRELLEHIQSLWIYNDYCIIKGKNVIRFELHTGGWSDHEEIIETLMKNNMFWFMYWEKSTRGGHYYFKIDTRKFIAVRKNREIIQEK